ncbi:MAG: hypothetical protein IPJ13_01835 [Saprospiraceae bacterium]|nr:hypothetical protein [Saprospiraceae bacterium]
MMEQETHLESPNGNIRIFEGTCIFNTPQNGGNWNTNLIPTTTNTAWSTEATQNAYQTFHVTSRYSLVPKYWCKF